MNKKLYYTLKNIERDNKNILEDIRSSDWFFLLNKEKFKNVLIVGTLYTKNFENLKHNSEAIDLLIDQDAPFNYDNKISIIKNAERLSKIKYDCIYIEDFTKFIINYSNNKLLIKIILNSNIIVIKNKFFFRNLYLAFRKKIFLKKIKYDKYLIFNFFPKEPIPLFICSKNSIKANKFFFEKIIYIINNLSYETKKRNRFKFLIGKIFINIHKFIPVYFLLKYFYFNNYHIFEKHD